MDFNFNKEKIKDLKEHFIDTHKAFRENIWTSPWEEGIRKAANLTTIYRKYKAQGKEGLYKSLLSDSGFSDLLYETIYYWMGRGKWALKREADYMKAVENIIERLEELRDESLENSVKQKRGICFDLGEKIKNVYIVLEATYARTKIIANSKTLHFLLPDLIPPVDGKHILKFFGINPTRLYSSRLSHLKQAELLIRIMHCYYEVLDFCFDEITQIYARKNTYDYSIPKTIDNAIWGYPIWKHNAIEECSKEEERKEENSSQARIIARGGRYDYELFWYKVREEFGGKLYTKVFKISEDESFQYFGRSIKKAMTGKCILEEGDYPQYVTATIPKYLGERGFSCRVGTKGGKKYVMFWHPSIREKKKT